MKYRLLGNTGLRISEVSFGCIPILKGNISILPNYYGLSVTEALSVMEKAYEQGCNLYDTAIVPEYGDAEIKVGKFKKYHPDIIISDKARSYTKEAMEASLKASLKNLSTDICDIYFVHQVAPENKNFVFNDGALDALVEGKKKGYIKCVGIATHHYDIALQAASDDRVDVIQIPGNIFERGIFERISLESSFKNVGILACKIFAAGTLPEYFSPSILIDFALSYPIHSAIVGMGSIGQVIAATNNLGTHICRMPLEEVVSKFEIIYDVIPCTRCQRCRCSAGIEIASIFRYYNYYYLGHRNWAHERLVNLDSSLLEKCTTCYNKQCQDGFNCKINIQSQIIKILKSIKKGAIKMDKTTLRPGKDYIGVGVGAVILKDNNILLLLRKKAPESGCWTIPGGKVEFGETVEEAILREVKEEVGAEGKILAPLGVTNHILKEEKTHYVSPRFLVELIDEPSNMEPQSHSEMKWFPIDSLPENVTLTTQKALSAFLTWKKA